MNTSQSRDAPAWGKDAVTDVTDVGGRVDALPLADLFEIAGAELNRHPAEAERLIHLASTFPSWWRAQEAQPSAKASRRVLAPIREAALALSLRPTRRAQRDLDALLWHADAESSRLIVEELLRTETDEDRRETIVGSPMPCNDEPGRVAAGATHAMKSLINAPGTRVDTALRHCVKELLSVYETISGRTATHARSSRKGYNGGVNTPAGKFCALFLNAVEPRAARRLAATLDHHLHRRG